MRSKLCGFFLTCLLASTATSAADTKGSFFAVIVKDMGVSLAWYKESLGLEIVTRMTESGQYDIVNLFGPGLFVELLELPAAAERPEGRIEGPFKLGMLVDDLHEFVAGLPESLSEAEIISDTNNGLLLLQLRDPDGNIVQVMEMLER